MDVINVAVSIGIFVLTWGFVALCGRLQPE